MNSNSNMFNVMLNVLPKFDTKRPLDNIIVFFLNFQHPIEMYRAYYNVCGNKKKLRICRNSPMVSCAQKH